MLLCNTEELCSETLFHGLTGKKAVSNLPKNPTSKSWLSLAPSLSKCSLFFVVLQQPIAGTAAGYLS